MSTQSEAKLENDLITQLTAASFESVKIENAAALKANLKVQLERANNLTLTEREFENVLISLEKGNIFDKSKRLKGKVDVFNIINGRAIRKDGINWRSFSESRVIIRFQAMNIEL